MSRATHALRLPLVWVALVTMVLWVQAPDLAAEDPTSIAGAGRGNWTTPQGPSMVNGSDYAVGPRYAVRKAVPCPPTPCPPPVAPLPGSAISTGPRWIEVPAAPAAEPPTVDLAPVAPPVVAAEPCPPPAEVCAPIPCETGTLCELPCCNGCSEWHVRALVGRSIKAGDDPADLCLFAGVDIGRTFCGCWGLDLYYRYHSGEFDRVGFTDDDGNPITEDGGYFNHVGIKFTYERGFSDSSRWYWWAGLGVGYFWTEDYVDDDDGIEFYGEAGVGFLLSRNTRIRAGVNVIVMDTSVGRENIVNIGQSRTHWVIAPVVEVEFTF